MIAKTVKKVMLVFFLLFISVIVSMIINYRGRGAFINVKKNLPIYSVQTNEKKIAITFDASWGEDNTQAILDVLDKYNVKATFFVVGGWVDEHPDLLKEIDKRGHEIGNHSDKHPDMTRISKDKIEQEIAVNDAKISNITGKTTNLFRCPSGSYNDLVVETVENSGHYCVQWDVDSIDWKEQGADLEYSRVLKNVKPGSILLFHNNAKYTPENLPRIIEKLKNEGYEFIKVGDLIYKDKYYIDTTGKQIPD